MNAKYIIRFDDFYNGMDIEKYSTITDWILKSNIPAIIGVVPAWERDSFKNITINDKSIDRTIFFQKMRKLQDNGSEIALHGYSHKLHKCKSILNVNQYGEFAGLPLNEQKNRIALGKKCFEEHGLTCRVFMAPAHSYDTNTLRALRSENIGIITDGKAFYPYQSDDITFIPQISSTPAPYPFGIITVCLHPQYLNAILIEKLQRFAIKYYDSIVSVDYALEYLNRIGLFAKFINKLVINAYRPYNAIKSAFKYLRTT